LGLGPQKGGIKTGESERSKGRTAKVAGSY